MYFITFITIWGTQCSSVARVTKKIMVPSYNIPSLHSYSSHPFPLTIAWVWATRTAVRWGHKNFKKRLSEETIQEFHTWLRAVLELSLSYDADSQLMERSSTPIETRIGGAGDMTTTSQATSTDTTDDVGEDLSETVFLPPEQGHQFPPWPTRAKHHYQDLTFLHRWIVRKWIKLQPGNQTHWMRP